MTLIASSCLIILFINVITAWKESKEESYYDVDIDPPY